MGRRRNFLLGGNKTILGVLFFVFCALGVIVGSVKVLAECQGQVIKPMSRFEPRLCVQASVDNGVTYGKISDVLKDYLNGEITFNDEDAKNSFSGDCITAKNGQNNWMYYGINAEKIPYDNIKVKVLVYLRWVDFRGMGYGAVDYRIVSMEIPNSIGLNDQNVLVGFCRDRNSNCPTFNQSIIDGAYRYFSNSYIISNGDGEVEILPAYGPNPGQQWVWTFDTRSMRDTTVRNYGITVPNRTQMRVNSQGKIDIRRCKADDNIDTCGCEFISNNAWVQLRYIAQEYQNEGLAEVYEGESVETNANHSSTDWQSNSKTAETIEVDCEDSGCYATFKLALRNKLNTGKAVYGVTRQKNSGNATGVVTTPGSPFAPGLNGTMISTGASDTYTAKELLKPGDQVCYLLNFDPLEVNNVTLTTLKVCAKAKATSFKGKSTLSGAVSGMIDWRNTSDTVTVPIYNCSPIYGCKVVFKQEMRRESDNGTSNYVVSRTSNLTDNASSRGIPNNSNLAKGVFPNGNGTVVYESGQITLYPGMVVCNQLTFDTTNNVNTSKKADLKICASALGDAQPPEPPDPDAPEPPDGVSGDVSLINIKVRNEDIAVYNKYQREVYAKPNDDVFYRGTYNPVLQYTYYIKSSRIAIDGGSTLYPSEVNSSKNLGTLFNENFASCRDEDIGCWKNTFSMFSTGITPAFSNDFKYNAGDMTKRSSIEEHKVMGSEAGSSLVGNVKTNKIDDTKTTVSQVTFVAEDDLNIGQIQTSSKEKSAYVRVPYNFVNTTYIDPDDNKLYAGENVKIKYAIDVNPRKNSVTDGTYATVVRNAKWKLELCYYDGCFETNPATGTLNSAYDIDGVKGSIKTTNIVIPDVDAGTEMCLRSAVFPANSGDERNYSDKNYSGTWQYSEKVCYKVAKRPSVQVWGGSIFSADDVTVPISGKKHVDGYNAYAPVNTNPYIVFGSWGELDIVAAGKVSGLASGAGTGFALDNSGVLWPSYNSDNSSNIDYLANYGPGGNVDGTSIQYCLRSTLSIANKKCSSGYVGAFGGMNQTSITSNKSTLINRFASGQDPDIEYKELIGNVTIPNDTVQGVIAKGKTVALKVSGNLTINGNIVYEDGYSTFSDIPKLVIYSEGNIVIGCNVTRIDAVLISDYNINSCDNDDINSKENSNQLVINGSIITDTLTLNRTYGAAKGANSIIPAEIVNYDATLYLWGANQASVSESAKLNAVYAREIAPRY